MLEDILVLLIIIGFFVWFVVKLSSAKNKAVASRDYSRFDSTGSQINSYHTRRINEEHDNTMALTALGVAAGLSGSMLAGEISDDHSHHHQIDDDEINLYSHNDHCDGINPATGLPMMGCVDLHGNPYGSDMNEHHGDAMTSFSDDNSFHSDDSWLSNDDSWSSSFSDD
jgi:hypothetical protein